MKKIKTILMIFVLTIVSIFSAPMKSDANVLHKYYELTLVQKFAPATKRTTSYKKIPVSTVKNYTVYKITSNTVTQNPYIAIPTFKESTQKTAMPGTYWIDTGRRAYLNGRTYYYMDQLHYVDGLYFRDGAASKFSGDGYMLIAKGNFKSIGKKPVIGLYGSYLNNPKYCSVSSYATKKWQDNLVDKYRVTDVKTKYSLKILSASI